jgi:hypothetical protein
MEAAMALPAGFVAAAHGRKWPFATQIEVRSDVGYWG